jgi:hypothetical protein
MLIEKLKGIQTREGMTDVVMAGRLGRHPVDWNGLKNGHRPVTAELVVQAVKAFPGETDLKKAGLEDVFGPDYQEILLPVYREILTALVEEEEELKRQATTAGQKEG